MEKLATEEIDDHRLISWLNSITVRPSARVLISALAFMVFASAVFVAQGPEPMLGPDHIVYLSLAKDIVAKQPAGDYIREWNSVRSLGVLIAYCYNFTQSYIVSLKVILFLNTLLFFAAYQLFSSLYIRSFWYRLLFTLVSGMAVSFGVASWGVSDYTALLPRTLGLPGILLCFWIFFKYSGDARRYLTYPLLVVVSIFHLSAFHAVGVLIATELIEWVALEKCAFSRRLIFLPISLALSFIILIFLQSTGKSMDATGFVKWLARPTHTSTAAVDVNGQTVKMNPDTTRQKFSFMTVVSNERHGRAGSGFGNSEANKSETVHILAPSPPPYTAAIAWETELSMRGWRNMPIPFVNFANILSSFILIASLAALGCLQAYNRGLTSLDKRMLALASGVIIGAFGLQTGMWILRNIIQIYPFNLEEIRSISFLMVPSLYFIYVLFHEGLSVLTIRPAKGWKTAVILMTLILPLAMKSLNSTARQNILALLCWTHIVDKQNENALQNARLSLGLAQGPRYYYDTRKIARWINDHIATKAVILSDRDDLLVESFPVIGTRQQAALANPSQNPEWARQLFLTTSAAMATHDSAKVVEAAREIGANYAIVDWCDTSGPYADEHFSLLRVD